MAGNDSTAGLPGLIAGLLDPDAYPHPAGDIVLVQTHISYVVLAGEFAYKVKKPLSLGFLDYSTLEKRGRMCEAEVRLNRRLCEDVYLGVDPIVRDGARYRVGGEGEAVEYAVRMRRVPAGRMMPQLLERGQVGAAELRSLGRTLAAFHARSETDARIAGFGHAETVRANWTENFDQTRAYLGRTVSQEQYERVQTYVDAFLAREHALIEERAAAGRTRDCHGDLRADSVVLNEDGSVCIMDCIEFNDRIRYSDVASDVAFMAMDLDFRGRRDLSDEFAGTYLAASGDDTLPLVLRFYKCYRAYVRGKVESLQIDEAEVPPAQRDAAAGHARRHFALADAYATTEYVQALIIMVGLSGSGKSYLTDALATRIGALPIISDVERKRLLGVEPSARLTAPYGAGAYTAEQRARVYAAMLERSREALERGRSVILDATFLRREDRDAARALAADAGVRFVAVLVEATEDAVRRHLSARLDQPETPSDARWEIYVAQRARFEPPDEIADEERITVDGALPVGGNVERIEARLIRPG